MTQLTPTQIAPTAVRLTNIVNKTPVLTSRTLNQRTGRQLFLKCENFQRVGAFKFRGAYNAIAQLSDAQKAAGVVTHSSGNHAQGVALAAKLLGIQATIVMPEDAPAIKRAATADYGATIVTCPAAEREAVSQSLIAEYGYTMVHPYDNDHIILGQGTAAFELFQEVGPLDTLFVPVGGGGLISGSALAAAALAPNCRVVGVEPLVANDANLSWQQNTIHTLDSVPNTVADGLRVRFIGERNLKVMRQYVNDMITVSEADIIETLAFVWARLKIIIEPSSAVALAPLLMGHYTNAGQRVGVIFSGGNVNVHDCGFLHTPPPATDSQIQQPAPSPHARRPRVLVTDTIAEAGLAQLQTVADVDVALDLSKEAFLNQIGNYQALVVGPETAVSEAMISYGTQLEAIGVVGSWLHRVAVSTARAHGIQICYAPDASAVAIAEHTLAYLLSLAIRFGDGRIAGKTLGLIGYGRVAEQVAKRAQAFDIEIIVNQPRLTPQLVIADGIIVTDLVDLLTQSDFVSLHIPFKAETDTIIGAEQLNMMKPTACIINTGHTDLIDETALLSALENGHLAGAALSTSPASTSPTKADIRHHPHVLAALPLTTLLKNQQQDLTIAVTEQIVAILSRHQSGPGLPLELVPTELVIPHEEIDDKRVARLMRGLEDKGMLINPPVTTFWNGRYIVLDGATRTTAFKRLNYPHLIVQVAHVDDPGSFELHTWYHVIASDNAYNNLIDHLSTIKNLSLTPLSGQQMSQAFNSDNALCYFLNRQGNAMLAATTDLAARLTVMNDLVAAYTSWGTVERTLITDLNRLQTQFPKMVTIAVFPQFKPETVFETASQGKLLPAGLTRFVIPGRILRLNASLAKLKENEPLPHKQVWFKQFLADKLARSHLRYYQEPVILLDE